MQQRASKSIGALAAALAKAQIELVNPEKTLVATIREEGRHGREQTFRYAPLSAGLEITRRVLGQHEIATLQRTSIDHASGLINLTTMLAHASGEWIASDWPVCPVGETASPRRMGAALTYACRYALFALVGIAGEDDLDAPDLQSPMSQIGVEGTKVNGGQQNGSGQRSARPEVTPRRAETPKAPTANPVLGLHASAKLRERLIVEIGELASAEEAAKWVQQSLAEKNRLRPSDAAHVEASFEAKLTELATKSSEVAQAQQRSFGEARDFAVAEPNTPSNQRARSSQAIDKSMTCATRATSHSRSSPHSVDCPKTVPRVWSTAVGPASPPIRAKPRSVPQSERRVHRSIMPPPPPRTPSVQR